uniref:TRC8-like N-terminal domain-containing protein n=1 Tax=Cairina moschata TaxID=8855 RepID=A0A8C3BTH0_CAIMO
MAATRPGGRHRAEPRPSPKWPPPGASPSLKMAEPRGPKAPVPASKMAAAASAAGGPSLRASPPRTGSAARGRSGRKRKWRRALGRRRVREGRRGRGPGPPGAPAQGQARPGRAGPGRGSSPGAPPGSPVPAMSRLEAAANVALRVPALALLDVLYRWDAAGPGPLPVLPGAASCLGHALCLVLLLLPVRALVQLYLHLLTALLLCAGHQAASPALCLHALRAPDEDPAGLAVRRPAAARAGPAVRRPPPGAAPGQHLRRRLQQRGGALRAQLPPPRPLPAGCRRLPRGHAGHGGVPAAGAGGVPVEPAGRPPPLPRLLAGALLPAPLLLPGLLRQRRRPAGAALRPAQQRGRVLQHALLPRRPHLHRLLPGPGRAQPLQVLPAGLRRLPQRQRHAPVSTGGAGAGGGRPLSQPSTGREGQERSRGIQYGMRRARGVGAPSSPPVCGRGVTEGVMLLLLALQTGLLDLQVLQRTFLLSIILFIVVTSTLQSMIEIADPIVLALGASRNRCRAPGGGQQEAARRQRVLLGGARGGGGPPWLSCAPPQEPLEAFPWCQHVPLPADLPLLHGLQDRPLLPPGLLAAHPGLQLHAHLPAGTGGPPAPGGGLHIPSHSPGSSPAPGRLSRASLGRWSTAVGWCRGVLCPASSTQRVPLPPQVLGTLFIYGLFVVELLQDTPLERMDEIIYGVTAVSRVLEFLVALCVVAYGSWESLVGEWSWMGASVIIVHSYFNVWLRAQSGWRSLLLRRQAAQKISSLPRATRGQLRDHDDVCAICFQVSPRSPPAPQGGLRSSPQGPCRRVTPPPCARRTCRWPSSPPAATSSTAPASASGSTCRTRAPCATSGSPRRPPRTMPAAGRGRRRGRPRRTRGWRTREPQRGPRRTSPPVGTACRQAQGTAGLVPAALSWVKKRRGPPHSPPGCPPARTRSSCCPPLPAPTPL